MNIRRASILLLIALALCACGKGDDGEQSMGRSTSAVVNEGASTAENPVDGQAVYDKLCTTCHTPGIAGAPKLGDGMDWEPRIAQGIDVLYEHSIGGYTGSKGIMPPKGGNPALSDAEVRAAVDYMVDNAR